MLESVHRLIINKFRELMRSCSLKPRVLMVPSQSWDFRLAKERFSTRDSESITDYLPFVAVQVSSPPVPVQISQPDFIVAKKYKEEGLYVGASALKVKLTYQARAYFKSETQRLLFCESFLLNHKQMLGLDQISVAKVEGATIPVSYHVDDFSILKEPEPDPGQDLTYSLSITLSVETWIVGKPFAGKLLLKPVVFVSSDDQIEEEVEYGKV